MSRTIPYYTHTIVPQSIALNQVRTDGRSAEPLALHSGTGSLSPPQVLRLRLWRQTVMISSSENAIRGLLMHLCDIPPDRISEVEIPTGLPLVYNINKRCIQVGSQAGWLAITACALSMTSVPDSFWWVRVSVAAAGGWRRGP